MDLKKDLKYNHAVIAIRKIIAERNLAAGDKIPSIRELVKILPYSEITVRRAFSELAASGVICKTVGSGTVLRKAVSLAKENAYILYIYFRHRCKKASMRFPTGLNDFLAERGMGLRCIQVEKFEPDLAQMAELASGIIIAGTPDKQFLDEIISLRLPAITAGTLLHKGKLPNISVDGVFLGYELTRCFIAQKKKNIMFYDHGPSLPVDAEYLKGYKKALREASLQEIILKKDYKNALPLMDHLTDFFTGHPDTDTILISPEELYQYCSWHLLHKDVKECAVGLLGHLPGEAVYRKNPDFLFLKTPDLVRYAGERLMDWIAMGIPAHSECLKGTVGGLDNDWKTE